MVVPLRELRVSRSARPFSILDLRGLARRQKHVPFFARMSDTPRPYMYTNWDHTDQHQPAPPTKGQCSAGIIETTPPFRRLTTVPLTMKRLVRQQSK